ncbi:RNA-binding protein [Paraburkholderia sp. Ac-20347]|jgi:hypothetical protein|uniref:RNA-binding protein n=1 Tax=Paraburkholderia sp. Ac-20347 TaxID=2703892 RepID=UPI00197FF2F2|nr:RNA-binding protein [Paraburkholderia sp. Ac-20347]MBN3814561.1 RNA-binding protein [Paraburkholderia sp. Ac-20347]
MADLLLGNVEENIADEEINAFLQKYGFPSFDHIQRVTGTGTHPAALLHYASASEEILRTLQPRVHHIFWNNRTITAQIIPAREAD